MRGADGFLFSFCLLAVFLLLGKALRVHVPLLQRLFLPSSIIAGFVALALGPYVLKAIPTWVLGYWRQIPGILISVVFASLFLGVRLPSPKRLWSIGGPQLCFGVVTGMGQYLVALLTTTLVLSPLFGTRPIFATIVEIGFSGGHGTAAGMRTTFHKLGFPAGADLAQMSATVGIIAAVVLGVVMINVAIRRGYCACLNERHGIPAYKRLGLIPEKKRYSIATATVATEAIEPLTFHFAIIAVAVLIGWGLLVLLKLLHPRLEAFPLFPLAMLGGLLVQAVATPLKITLYFDRDTFDRLLGFSLDVLVIAAIAAIRLDLFLDHLWPFLIVMATGIGWVVFTTAFVAPRMFPNYWFERAITEYGMQTGVTAIGLLLLRLVDPMYKTDTATAFGFKQMIYEPFLGGGLVTALSPILIHELGPWVSMAVSAAIMAVFGAISHFSGWTRRDPALVFEAPHDHPVEDLR
ncbi:MAG: sodium:glutamate symporter [Proteobacteria bacterium]|nr:sodium:glutamate symporter [Pseudomonadota bacterium]